MTRAAVRLVALGASNLQRDLPTIAAALSAHVAAPLDVVAASGNGRAYGAWSRCAAIRALPGIVECGLWTALETGPQPHYVVLTDIGNDLVYGASAEAVVAGVTTCVERLERLEPVHRVLVLPPVAEVAGLPPWRYRLAKRLLFPTHEMGHSVLVERLKRVEAELHVLADRYDMRVIQPKPEWYGVDPIHPKPAGRTAFRDQLFSEWGFDNKSLSADARVRATALEARLRWRPLIAAEARVLGRWRRRTQPVFDRPGDATVACF